MKNKTILIFIFIILSFFNTYGAGNDAVVSLNKAVESFKRGDYYRAVEYYKTTLSINPNYVDAMYGLAGTYMKLGEFKEAYIYIKKARVLDKYSVKLRIMEGRILTSLGKFNEAESIIESVLTEEPNNREGRAGLAELYIAEGDYLNAIEIYNSMLQYAPDDRRTLLSLIIILDSKGLYGKSDKYVEKTLRLFPENSTVQYTAAKHFLQEGNTARVESHARAAVSLDPENKEAVLLLTKLLMNQERYSEAATLLESILKNDRAQPSLWYMLGETYRLSGNSKEALRSYSIGVGIAGNDEIIRIALENCIVKYTDVKDPVRKRYSDYHFEMGKSFEDKNYLRKAKFEYRRGLYIDPHSEKGWLLYADLLKTEGFTAKYVSILRETAKNGIPDTDLLDRIEIYESMMEDTVSYRWKINQFEIEKPVFRIMLYSTDEQYPASYYNCGFYVNSYLGRILTGNERIEVLNLSEIHKYSDAFNAARRNNTDYFVKISPAEKNNVFEVDVKVYSSRTGTLLKSFSVFRTGNNRLSNALERVSYNINSIIPLRGTLLKREFNNVLIDLGSADGVSAGKVFYITKPSEKLVIGDDFNFRVNKDDIIGEVKVVAVDDLVSEGAISKYGFFDMITPGDFIFLKDPDKKEIESDKQKPENTGSVSSLYKTILTIP